MSTPTPVLSPVNYCNSILDQFHDRVVSGTAANRAVTGLLHSSLVTRPSICWNSQLVNSRLNGIIDAVRIVCEAGSMKRSSVRPCVCLSHRSTAAAACGGFAAERLADRKYQSTAAARRSAANAGRAMLTAELTRLNTDLLLSQLFQASWTFKSHSG